MLLLALWNGTKNKGSLDVESVSLGLFLFVVRLTIIFIILHIAVVGGGVEGGRRRGRHRVGPRVAEALRLQRQKQSVTSSHMALQTCLCVSVCVCSDTHETFRQSYSL